MHKHRVTLFFLGLVVFTLLMSTSFGNGTEAGTNQSRNGVFNDAVSSLPQGYTFFNYNPSKAVSYGMLVHQDYYQTSTYPAGINNSIMQKNLDHYSSEDCAHFVSEALIAGGLTILSANPPGDNLAGYMNGQFVGSYGIVGVYRLVSFLAGYTLPIFMNTTAESFFGYQPVPASFSGTPLATVYYVTNDTMMPSYFLSPGDVIADGGVGGGHVMLYTGNGQVVQTDPATTWGYVPGPLGGDANISNAGYDTLNGSNVSSLYIHMPTFSSVHTISITILSNGMVLKPSSTFSYTTTPSGSSVYLVGSFPDGVGIGNYSYSWYDNGNLISTQQNLSYNPQPGANHLKLESTGSNGTATTEFTFYSGSVPISAYLPYIAIGIVVAAAIAATVLLYRSRGKKN